METRRGKISRKRIEFDDVKYPRENRRNDGEYLLPLAIRRSLKIF